MYLFYRCVTVVILGTHLTLSPSLIIASETGLDALSHILLTLFRNKIKYNINRSGNDCTHCRPKLGIKKLFETLKREHFFPTIYYPKFLITNVHIQPLYLRHYFINKGGKC